MKIDMNGSAMGPHGLIFDEDGAKSRPMPLDTLPTSRGVVLESFLRILGSTRGRQNFPDFFPYISLLWGTPDIPPVVEVMLSFSTNRWHRS